MILIHFSLSSFFSASLSANSLSLNLETNESLSIYIYPISSYSSFILLSAYIVLLAACTLELKTSSIMYALGIIGVFQSHPSEHSPPPLLRKTSSLSEFFSRICLQPFPRSLPPLPYFCTSPNTLPIPTHAVSFMSLLVNIVLHPFAIKRNHRLQRSCYRFSTQCIACPHAQCRNTRNHLYKTQRTFLWLQNRTVLAFICAIQAFQFALLPEYAYEILITNWALSNYFLQILLFIKYMLLFGVFPQYIIIALTWIVFLSTTPCVSRAC